MTPSCPCPNYICPIDRHSRPLGILICRHNVHIYVILYILYPLCVYPSHDRPTDRGGPDGTQHVSVNGNNGRPIFARSFINIYSAYSQPPPLEAHAPATMLRASAAAGREAGSSQRGDRVRFSSPQSSSETSPGSRAGSRKGRRRLDAARMMLRRGRQQLRETLIGDLPASLSLRTRVRITLEVSVGRLYGLVDD